MTPGAARRTFGLPQPAFVWLGYLVPELVIPVIIIAAQTMTKRSLKQ